MAVLGKTEADMEAMRKQAPKGVAGGLIGSFIASLILAIFLEYGRLANVVHPAGAGGGGSFGSTTCSGFPVTSPLSSGVSEGAQANSAGSKVAPSSVQSL